MTEIISRLLRALLSRIDPQAQQAAPPSPQQDAAQLVAAGTEQEFNGSPEEALILNRKPPIAKVRGRIILPISQAGEIPEVNETIKLTPHGKIVSRTEFLTMDGNHSVGRPEQVKGFCQPCGRFSFQGGTCEACGLFVCTACALPFEEKDVTHRLCPACDKKARWSKNTWE